MEKLTLREIEYYSKFYVYLSEKPKNAIFREYKGDFAIKDSASIRQQDIPKILQSQLINMLLVENCTKGKLYQKPDFEVVQIFYDTLDTALSNRDMTYLYKSFEKDFALRFDNDYQELFAKLLCDRVYKNEHSARQKAKEISR